MAFTKQDTFDIVVAHLRQQGARSIRRLTREEVAGGVDMNCLYRDRKHNRMCAAGVLIPENRYRPTMETTRADMGDVRVVLSNLGHDPGFVRELQLIHDYNKPSRWEPKFRALAKEHGLTYRKP